jgi:hypothetical protein
MVDHKHGNLLRGRIESSVVGHKHDNILRGSVEMQSLLSKQNTMYLATH